MLSIPSISRTLITGTFSLSSGQALWSGTLLLPLAKSLNDTKLYLRFRMDTRFLVQMRQRANFSQVWLLIIIYKTSDKISEIRSGLYQTTVKKRTKIMLSLLIILSKTNMIFLVLAKGTLLI